MKTYYCKSCEKSFERKKRREKYQNVLYCSNPCKGKATKKHGDSTTTFYRRFASLKKRCTYIDDQAYHRYGGRGIKCLWESYEEFKGDMYESYLQHVAVHKKKNTWIDRINNDGNYCKENCRWVTVKENCYNKSNTVTIEINGKKMFLPEISEKYGINISTLRTRFYRGWDSNKIISPIC